MTYVEVSRSKGCGTLLSHILQGGETGNAKYGIDMPLPDGSLISRAPLTEQEAQAFYTMHGDSWVAV